MTATPDTLESLPGTVPVLISGGGPSGLFLALDLASRGVRSVVIEPRLSIDPHRPRAKTSNARTMTHLRRLGLAEELRAAAPLPVAYAQDVIFCSSLTGHEVTRFPHAFQLETGRYDHQPECGQQVPQPVVEEVLRAAVERSPLISLHTGVSVQSLVQDADGTSQVRISGDNGRTRTVRARFTAAADGGASVIRKGLGIALEGSSAARSNLSILFRSRALGETISLGRAVQYWVMNPGAAGMVGRMDLDQTWWAILQGVDPEHLPTDPAALIRAMVGTDVDIDVLATDPWTARMLLAAEYRRGSVFLVGDAAHLNPPWGGHGFNTCIGDAANLAWKLAAVLQGWGSPDLLATYGPERRPVAGRTIADAATNGNALAYHFADAKLDANDDDGGRQARDAARNALAVKRSEFDSLGLVLGYAYPESPLVATEDTPPPTEDPIRYVPTARPGYLLPHTWLADGTSVYDALGAGFTLLFDPERITQEQFAPLETVAAERGIPLALAGITAPAGMSLSRLWEAPAVLVRPDQHVAWRGVDGAAASAFLPHAAGWADLAEDNTFTEGTEHDNAVIS